MKNAEDQNQVIAFLERPESYGLAGPVQRIDTHVAIVFLAGERAYKLKRAVGLSYLDFSTAEKRKVVCEAELLLNRRTAPDLYLAVQSVDRLANGKLAFGGGEPVDWLVVMRRFATANLFSAVASRGELTDQVVRELADEIARFHESAEIVHRNDGAERIRRVIEGNADSMLALPPSALLASECNSLFMRSMAEWSKLKELLDQRATDGRVRHCHGDLHLANICLWQGKPTLFDCLEFDADLASIDVLYDVAFLLMDLWERGFCSQASLLFNRYLDTRDEAGGLAALPLFLSMRSAVRAHVIATPALKQSTQQANLHRLEQANGYLCAALQFLDHAEPRLIAIGGLSGTGKSTLAGALAPMVGGAPGARWLRTDVLRKRLAGTRPEMRLPPAAYTRENNAIVYGRLLEDAAKVLGNGHSVIMDGVFADPEERTMIATMARSSGVHFTPLWLSAGKETLIKRVTKRFGDASDADRSIVERQIESELGDLGEWMLIDAEGSREQVLARALTRID